MAALIFSLLIGGLTGTIVAPPSGIADEVAGCGTLRPPVTGERIRGFAPVGRYGGHWGLDFGVPEGTFVRAAGTGTVTFAGSVAGMKSVTVDHGGGLKTSYSYLSEVMALAGDWVLTGEIVGSSGDHHGVAALHFSVRVNDEYRDPTKWLACPGPPADALWLAPAYSSARATRHPRRNIRPAPFWPPLHGRSGVSAARARCCHISPCRCPVAEARSRRRPAPPPAADDAPGDRRSALLRGRR